ncbi:MAG: COX15/CtaA family protein, partial [Candidatus Methylomirabilis sp.]|nr:COX15/CtaA family protein [Deltaproteobacteria bacterium]
MSAWRVRRESAHQTGLARFAKATAAATFFLLFAGAMVTSTGSGLSVPDWPLSYGTLMPPMVGGIFYEHGHRMVATAVGLLTVVLAAWLWVREERLWVRRLGLAALGLVVAQGVLGGLTVLLLLPAPVSSAHATLGQTFFLVTILIAYAVSREWRDASVPALRDSGGAPILGLAWTAIAA